MPNYPYPQPNITTAEGLFTHVNTVTQGASSLLVVVSSFIVLFIVMKARMYKTSDSLALSGMFTVILGSFIWALGLIQGNILVLFLIVTIAGTIWSFFEH